MNASYTTSCTARPPSSSTAHSHGRSHSLSDPRSFVAGSSSLAPPSVLSSSTLEVYDLQTTAPAWQHPTITSVPYSALPSPNLGPVPSANGSAHPHVAHRASSPQSMVSSDSPKVDSPVTPSSSVDTANPTSRSAGKKSSIDRNPKPCGRCSSSKRKCKPIPGNPNLCERCKNSGYTECSPHVSWTMRKQSMVDGGNLSPNDVDDSALSSRSASPSYFGVGGSPVPYSNAFQSPPEHGAYTDMSTTQEWVQTQTQIEASPNAIDLGAYSTFYMPPARQHVYGGNVPPLQIAQHWQNNQGLPPPALPVCHACNTPYNEYLMLNYALAHLSANLPCPPYELDQSMLKTFGHVPPQDPPYDGQY